MSFDEKDLPKWNSAGIEPPDSKKSSGFGPGDKPPADWFNWFFNRTYKALQNLFANAQDKSEKGKANGYAALNAQGKVVNADGTPAGGVQSVNGKTGTITLTASDVGTYSKAEIDAITVVKTVNGKSGTVTLSASDVGAETPTGAQAKANAAEGNAKKYSDDQLAAHQADEMPHQSVDTILGKKYKWGVAIQNGQWGLIYEEVQ